MTEFFEVVGLTSLTVAGFMLATSGGFAVIGVGCLWLAWKRAR